MSTVPAVFGRRGRRADRLPTPPPFPPSSFLTGTLATHLPSVIDSLALPANFSISTPSARSLLKHALYSFVLAPDSPHRPLFFADKGKGKDQPIGDDWSLVKAQASTNPSGTAGRSGSGSGGGGEYSESRRGKVCGHVFKAGESVYRCRDCSLDSTCVLCAKCFHGSSHTRHDVTMSVHEGVGAGCCDCGDVEAFKDECTMDCKFHALGPGLAPCTPDSPQVAALKLSLEGLLRVLVDWMISVLEQSPAVIISPASVEDIAPTVPPSYRHNPAASPIDELGDFPFVSPPSYSSSTSRGKARASSPSEEASTPAGPWSVVLWNDEKHSFRQVIDQVSRATGVSHRDAGEVAQRVDVHGRDIVYISSDPAQLLFVSRLISEIDLAVSVRSSLETFFEEVAGELVLFMKDLCAAKVDGQGGVLSEVLAKVLLERGGPQGMSRFQRLLSVDSRLWKAARKGLAEVYVTLLGVSPGVKMDLSVHFAQIYATIAESYLLSDREPEHSIISFGVQVFTVPSVSAFLVSKHQFLSGLIAILYAFFTEQRDSPLTLRLPPLPTIRHIDPESPAFRHKRYFQVFSDLNHLITSAPVRRIICEKVPLIDEFSSFLDLFTSMNPNRRAVSTHVEYESDAWVTAFNVTIQLAKLCRTFGEAYRQATSLELALALSTLLHRLPGPRPAFHLVRFGSNAYHLVDFDVGASNLISFHHPLGWLFSEMVKNIDVLDASVLEKEVGVASLSDIVVGRGGPNSFLAAMDHPLRVIVLLAQIRAGLWVRNGFGMRAQQLHYKEYSLRENTYDQDVFFLQTALVVLDPSMILIAILDRFQVQDWLSGSDTHPMYERGQAFAMVEEMLYLLILLLSDSTFAAGIDLETALRREIVHHLCLGPLLYSELMRRVSEKFADDPALDRILAEVANFKAPVGTADQGTYSLRPERFADVNPYFSRFSRNQREEADKIVREQLKKTTGVSDPVIVPTRLEITRGPFVTLAQTFNSDVLHQIIFFSMRHGRSRGELFSEVLVDEAIHLAMLALVEQPDAFVAFAERQLTETPGEQSLVHLLVTIEEDDRMKSVRHKVRWCLDRLTERIGPSVTALRKVEDTASPAKALDVKRLAAKARQAAIMKQFAQAQQSFLESSENIEDEDEDEMEGAEPPPSLGSCIVCQDELTAASAFGCLAFVQSSDMIRVTPKDDSADFQREVLATPSSLDRDASAIRPFGVAAQKVPVSADDESGDGISKGYPQLSQSGLHASACGHMMHLECFETYYRSVEHRHAQQPTRGHPENTDRREFTCPLCKSLGNVLLPASVDDFVKPAETIDPLDLDSWAQGVLDPVAFALEKGVPATELDEFHAQARQLRPQGSIGLTPWDISVNVVKSMRHRDGPLEGHRLMMSRLLGVAYAILQEVGEKKKAYLPNELVAFTLSAIEIASRGVADPAAVVSEATTRMLESLLSVLSELVYTQTASRNSSALASASVIAHIGGLFASDQRRTDFYLLDPLATIVEAAAVLPASFHQVVAFCFYTELARTFLSVNALLERSDEHAVTFQGDAADDAVADYTALAQIRLLFLSPNAQGINGAPGELTLGKYLYAYTLPFLRRAAILQRVLFGKPATETDPFAGSELARLLHSLRIPHPAQMLRPGAALVPGHAALHAHLEHCRNAIPGWRQTAASPNTLTLDPTNGLPLVLEEQILAFAGELQHPAIYELVGLPAQLDTLAAESLRRECGRCRQVPAEPALCLFCGQIVCHQSFCCMDGEEEAQNGECNMHMWTCGGSVGIFFIVKKNLILYLYTDKGTFSTPPYLDSHGEVNLGGRRSRTQFPQFLHQGRYDEIRKVWLNHGIPTFVARKLEATMDFGGWTTM